MTETATFYTCVALFSAVMACNVVALARHYRALHMAWIAIKSLEAHNKMLFEFFEAQCERTRTGRPSEAGDQRDERFAEGGSLGHVDRVRPPA